MGEAPKLACGDFAPMSDYYFVVLVSPGRPQVYFGGRDSSEWSTGVNLRRAFRWTSREFAREVAIAVRGRVVRVRCRKVAEASKVPEVSEVKTHVCTECGTVSNQLNGWRFENMLLRCPACQEKILKPILCPDDFGGSDFP
jgi:hypothetical protein